MIANELQCRTDTCMEAIEVAFRIFPLHYSIFAYTQQNELRCSSCSKLILSIHLHITHIMEYLSTDHLATWITNIKWLKKR